MAQLGNLQIKIPPMLNTNSQTMTVKGTSSRGGGLEVEPKKVHSRYKNKKNPRFVSNNDVH